jgi:hypothetical protein
MRKLKLLLLFSSFISLLFLSNCNVIDGITGKDEKQEPSIHPVLLNGKWGYIDQSGKMVISPRFDEARDVSDNYAAVRTGTLWGIVQKEPIQVITTERFSTLGDFEDGLAPAQLPTGQYGYVDGTGEFVIEPQFDFAAKFSDGLGAVRSDGLWGYVNSSGNTAIEPTYSDARSFSDGLAAVETFNGWVYIDNSGSTVLAPSFQITDAGEFENGIAPIQTVDGWGYINKSGSPVITPKYDNASKFSEGRAWVNDDGYVGFIDSNGSFIIPAQFNTVKAFSENMAAVRVNNDWFYISKKSGKIVINEPYENAESFINGIARVQKGENENATYGYIDKDGKYIWFPTK